MDTNKKFEKLVSNTILFETGGDKSGAYTDDSNDAGGPTKWGISQKSNPGVNIKTLVYKDAVKIYKAKYWNPLYDFITDDALAFKVFDMGVLMGPTAAVKLLQQAIVVRGGITTKTDGVFGPMTLTALSVVYMKDADTYQAVYNKYVDLLAGRLYITSLLPQNWKYRKGWLYRAKYKLGDKDAV